MPRYILSRFILPALALALLTTTSRALASDLYSLDSVGAGGTIYKLNQSTAAETLVGPVGAAFTFPGDLASDTHLGTFRIWSPDITSSTLLKIDPVTGAGTPIGLFTAPSGAPIKMVSLAFDNVTSTLYGNTSLAFDGSPDRLFRIDPITAASTLIGTGIGFTDVFALGFNNAGKLYGVSNGSHQLILIDTTLGSGGLIAPVGPGSIFDIASRPEDDVTFAVNAFTNELFTLDLTTGATTLVGPHTTPTHNMVGLAFGPAVPEPATLTLLSFAATLLTLRRKR
ncbi:MAG TPA: PEP-CTERM sorting domain-containing protein [Tepidisphaeraceae bacterium]|nr:PEP-CTERM sorting domain-containing protein [Tepidisphaeraceae bacterium]